MLYRQRNFANLLIDNSEIFTKSVFDIFYSFGFGAAL